MAADIPENNAVNPEGADGQSKKKHKGTAPPAPPLHAELHIPAATISEYKTNKDKNYGLERWKLLVEALTLIAVVWYACIARGQLNGILDSNKINRATYEAADRPYIGVSGISIFYAPANATSPDQVSQSPQKDTKIMPIRVEIKNFGPVPGTDFDSTLRGFLNGVEIKGSVVPHRAATIFPGQIIGMPATVGSRDYPLIRSGKKKFEIEVTVEYNRPTGHEKYCERDQYIPDLRSFISLGSGCTE